MKTPNTPDQVTRDNRKNWPKFILVMLLCTAGGAVLGYGSAWLVGSYSFDALADAAGRAAGACAPFAVLAAVPFLLAALACCRRARALFAAWDGEDEEIPARADARLDWALVWLTTAQLLALLLFAVSVSMMPLGYAGPGAILASAAELLAVLFAVIALQGVSTRKSRAACMTSSSAKNGWPAATRPSASASVRPALPGLWPAIPAA